MFEAHSAERPSGGRPGALARFRTTGPESRTVPHDAKKAQAPRPPLHARSPANVARFVSRAPDGFPKRRGAPRGATPDRGPGQAGKRLRPVAPVRRVASYIGGKKLLARRLVAAIERAPHQLYVEPFVGMGGVFLRRRLAPKVEAINDASRDVATFFRVLHRHYQALMDTSKSLAIGNAF